MSCDIYLSSWMFVYLAIPPSSFQHPLILALPPNLFLPRYWPADSLLSQWEQVIFTVYKGLFHSSWHVCHFCYKRLSRHTYERTYALQFLSRDYNFICYHFLWSTIVIVLTSAPLNSVCPDGFISFLSLWYSTSSYKGMFSREEALTNL